MLLSGTALVVLGLLGHPVLAADPAGVDFNRDIRPILSNNCFQCHGPDADTREADLRLDTAEGAFADLGGYQAIKPGDPDASAVIERVTATDEFERMPPPESGLELSEQQIDLLRRWIEQGAAVEQHWAFQAIRGPTPPAVDSLWAHNPIDTFVLARLEPLGLAPSPEADRQTLIRRVHLDLLGLPPSLEEVDAFVADPAPDAYERMVDRALASPHYGERWGRHWLDQARYADTNGYSIDSERSMWPYRDWVIRALNADMPFDQFSIEQLAGDLLPSATVEQQIATGFHRNTLINQEGGTDREQFRNEAVVDRVNTTGAVWLGLTLGCAQCHTHKFDPLSHHEYYQFFAFFNSGQDVNSAAPTLSLPTPEQQRKLAEYDEQIRAATTALAEFDRRKKEQSGEAEQAEAEQAEAEQADAEQADAEQADEREPLAAELKRLQDAKKKFATSVPTTMIMRDLDKPRETHLLIRGDFLRKGDPVVPNTPAVLPPMPEPEGDRNRHDLARWLVDPQNPLTPRVTVNRVWGRYFGQGLVETENDFGIQGTPPTHPELLDWLAAEFVECGWSLKHLKRQILTSATYRQASIVRPELERMDPLNKLLGRQTRLRVEAEIVRDLGLSVSGLLQNKVGGPSVYPPQPAGVYAFTQRRAAWPTSKGADRYRRGMYTFFMRSVPYPMLTTFDTPKFNTTCTSRVRSNTPLQSLTLANDETTLEFSRAFAQRVLRHPGDHRDRVRHAFQICFARQPESIELDRLAQYFEQQRREFVESADDARQIAGDGVQEADVADVAAWTVLARVLLNLDEFITRE